MVTEFTFRRGIIVRPTSHLLLGVAAGAAITLAAGAPNGVVFFAASMLIDADHYADFVYHSRFRSFNPRAMFRFHALLAREHHRREFLVLHLFHSVEFLGAIACIAFYRNVVPLQFVLYGMCFHLLCDWGSMIAQKTIFNRAISVTEYVIRRKRLLRFGLSSVALLRKVARQTRERRQ